MWNRNDTDVCNINFNIYYSMAENYENFDSMEIDKNNLRMFIVNSNRDKRE